MTISLSPEYEKLIQQKVQSGEFPTAEAVVEFALNRLMSGGEQTPALTSEERVRILDEFFAEVWIVSLSPTRQLCRRTLSLADTSTTIIGTVANWTT